MPPSQRSRPWSDAAPAPLVLLIGPEETLAVRALELIVAAVRANAPETSTTTLTASAYAAGALADATGPSLFAEPHMVVVDDGAAMTEEFAADALAYAAAPANDVTVVLRHRGGNRGKKVLDTWRTAGAAEYACPAITRDADLVQYAGAEFARADRQVRAAAVRALVDAVGSDLAAITAACRQLVQDVDGAITENDVVRYYGTTVNATGFAVADAAIQGKTDQALTLVRHALDTGIDPVPLVAALGIKLRTLAKVGAARGRAIDPKRDLGLAPWQVERATKDLSHWEAGTLADAIAAVASADADVKGATRNPRYAVERAVRVVAGLAD